MAQVILGPGNDTRMAATGGHRNYGGAGDEVLKNGVDNDSTFNSGWARARHTLGGRDGDGRVGSIFRLDQIKAGGGDGAVFVDPPITAQPINGGGNHTLPSPIGDNKLGGSQGNDLINRKGGASFITRSHGANPLADGLRPSPVRFAANTCCTSAGTPDVRTSDVRTADARTADAGTSNPSIASAEIGTSALPHDVITDFRHGQGDVIDLTRIDADTLTALDQAFTFIGGANFALHAGELQVLAFDSAGTANDYRLLSGDTNGDGIADFSLQLTGLGTIKPGDFLL